MVLFAQSLVLETWQWLSDISLDYQIQIVPQIIDGMSIGTEQNINFACHYSRFIDTEQSFDVTQASFLIKVDSI